MPSLRQTMRSWGKIDGRNQQSSLGISTWLKSAAISSQTSRVPPQTSRRDIMSRGPPFNIIIEIIKTANRQKTSLWRQSDYLPDVSMQQPPASVIISDPNRGWNDEKKFNPFQLLSLTRCHIPAVKSELNVSIAGPTGHITHVHSGRAQRSMPEKNSFESRRKRSH